MANNPFVPSSGSSVGDSAPPLWVPGTTYAQSKVVLSPGDFCYYVRKVAGAGATDPSSDTTNWQPTGDRAIKSIQRGVIAMSAGSTTGTATITAVVTAKTELRMLGFSTGGPDNTFSPRLSLTNTTTITATKTSTTVSGTDVSWELTERY